MTNKDHEESLIVSERISAELNRCWWNACKAIQTLPEYFNATYVEGMAVVVNIPEPFEHGWIVCNGVIIDPTLEEHFIWYFPSFEFKGKEGIRAFLQSNPKWSEPPFYKSPRFRKIFSICRKCANEFRHVGIHDRLTEDEFVKQGMDNTWAEILTTMGRTKSKIRES